MKLYEIGEKVYLKEDPDELDIVQGVIVKVCEEKQRAYVAYETDDDTKYRWVPFDELEYCMDCMLETVSWF